jgi:N-acetylglucosaminyldiphosphoundecaprenol N-acetyl-beta-D-mannosaminyltransferase
MTNQITVNVVGVNVSLLGLNDVLRLIRESAAKRTKAIFDYANIHSLNTAYGAPWLRDYYNRCKVVFCDGTGVRIAAGFLGKQIPARLSPPDWIEQLAAQCAELNHSVFLLGGKGKVSVTAAESLVHQAPRLRVVGTHDGYFDKGKESPPNREVVEKINRTEPDILIVGFGIPLQERWILENRQDLNVGVFLAAGAMFDYISGAMWRAPRWMTDNGLEWLGRLVREPRRLWRRYLIGIPVFLARVLWQKLGRLSAQ